jgi:hypothetical protein
MKIVNGIVSYDKQEMNRMLRRGAYCLFVVAPLSSWSLSYDVTVDGKIKSDEEAKKKQNNRIDRKVILVAISEFEFSVQGVANHTRVPSPNLTFVQPARWKQILR